MHIFTVGVSVLGLASVFPLHQGLFQSTVETYVSSESTIAKAGVLANIGPDGEKDQGAHAGVVVASPSTTDPNYVYSWTRDSSLVFKMLIDQYTTGIDTSLRGHIDAFVSAEATLQQISNPSGSVSTGGLGEPKFNIDLSAFTGPWGRPQRDGPALRATALVTYANWLIDNSNTTFVSSTLWPMIKLDLDYVSLNWNLSTFDLWEEIDSSSLFTSAVQHRSLREGISLASSLGQSSAISSYATQADNILCFMQSFWHSAGSSPYMTANTGGGRSGIDVNSVLTSIHIFDPDAGCDSNTFQPCSDKALANLLTYIESFRSVYGLNTGLANDTALATGRYPEDVYMGGNPWYLATFAVAEQLYDALQVWSSEYSLSVTSLSQPFFALFNSSITAGTYPSSSSTYSSLTAAVKTYADSYIALAANYTPSDGGLAEQYGKDDGKPLSAVDLTWSYASAITAFQARNGTNARFASWGAKGLSVPAICATEGGGNGQMVQVTFNVDAETVTGESIYLTGSANALAEWSTDDALSMSSTNYPKWSVTISLPSNSIVQYKYIRKNSGSVTWEADPNNQFTTPASGMLMLSDSWR
ncbi:glucoamylase [Phellopilus nigrolimitatus]|nr:glucoamylase [Phellopilus nigrolimitatus]